MVPISMESGSRLAWPAFSADVLPRSSFAGEGSVACAPCLGTEPRTWVSYSKRRSILKKLFDGGRIGRDRLHCLFHSSPRHSPSGAVVPHHKPARSRVNTAFNLRTMGLATVKKK